MSARQSLTEGFQRWLEGLVPTPTSRIRPGRLLDPFGSSTRTVDALLIVLLKAEQGNLLDGWSQRTADQRMIDLRDYVGGTPQQTVLTPLGDQVLTKWRNLEIIDPTDRCGLARCIALARINQADDRYADMARFWRELTAVRPADEWLTDAWGLAAVPYLVRTEHRYTPFDVMLAAGVEPWKQKDDLIQWAAQMPVPDGWQENRLTILLRTIEGYETRIAGRETYCRGEEAIRLASGDLGNATNALARWGIEGT